MSTIRSGRCVKCFVFLVVFLRAELRLCLTSQQSFGMVVFAKSTIQLKGEVIMSRKREAVFMGLGILAGLALSGPAVQAADYLKATISSQPIYVDGQQVNMTLSLIHI